MTSDITKNTLPHFTTSAATLFLGFTSRHSKHDRVRESSRSMLVPPTTAGNPEIAVIP
jgi:hypothetical protein